MHYKILKENLFTCLIICFSSISLFAQPGKGDKDVITFGGYINWSAFYDSHQTISLRDGQFLLYPSNKQLDKFGNDINGKANFNMLSVQSRINAKVNGPDILGAKTSGFIEAEFFGTSDGDANGVRMRHAFISFKWKDWSLLLGQTWHPMFISEAFPQVVSFNTGAPFQPFSRNPQIKITRSLGNFNLIGVLYSQRDFTSNGPAGFSSSYLRNSVIPGMDLQLQLKLDKILIGVGADYKILTPRLETNKKLSTDINIKSAAGIAYFKFKNQTISFITEAVYGQNLTDVMMLGGYAVASIDTLIGKENYTNLSAYSIWTDISTGKGLQFGIFAGYSENTGSKDKISGAIYSRTPNLGKIFRVSPRIQYSFGKINIGIELEYTKAFYGTPNNFGKIIVADKVNNTRLLIGAFYNL